MSQSLKEIERIKGQQGAVLGTLLCGWGKLAI